jgi:hypothetical protein
VKVFLLVGTKDSRALHDKRGVLTKDRAKLPFIIDHLSFSQLLTARLRSFLAEISLHSIPALHPHHHCLGSGHYHFFLSFFGGTGLCASKAGALPLEPFHFTPVTLDMGYHELFASSGLKW